jgi:hypothetical protein
LARCPPVTHARKPSKPDAARRRAGAAALIRTAQPHFAPHAAQPQASATFTVWAAGGRAAGRRPRDAAGGGHGVRHDPRQQCADRRHLRGPPTRPPAHSWHLDWPAIATRPNARMHELRVRGTLARTRPWPQPNALAHRCRQRRGLR